MLDKLKKIYQNGDVSMPSILATTKCSELGDLTLEQAFELYEQASSWAGDSVISCEKSELPTKITSSADDFPLPDEFWDAVYEFLQDKYGRDAKKYAQSYGVEVIVSDIEWADL